MERLSQVIQVKFVIWRNPWEMWDEGDIGSEIEGKNVIEVSNNLLNHYTSIEQNAQVGAQENNQLNFMPPAQPLGLLEHLLIPGPLVVSNSAINYGEMWGVTGLHDVEFMIEIAC
ncbi:hypothetical protein DEU56DRAFT_752447 [Suillus clintonianus]|uniref:uncharacterized protein n=1 Tax=Suillus clintonianus TaxID=1904413 RepID=UPI001B865F9F|nr:uncharacterized protein DEU56DRAFT_752447 [Suillus clintonianus]KAG2150773.1 hypothetical protein DEU56DRAFT_752447 [Suillus clintonianus]